MSWQVGISATFGEINETQIESCCRAYHTTRITVTVRILSNKVLVVTVVNDRFSTMNDILIIISL